MKAITNLFGAAIILGIAALMLVGAYYGAGYLWDVYVSLEPVVRVVLLTGVITAFMCAGIVSTGLRVTARLAVKGRLSEARYDLYTHITDLYRENVSHSDTLSNSRRVEVLTELARVESDIMMLAGGASLNAHHELKQAIESGENEYDQLTNLLAQLIKGFRRDLGHAYNYEELKFSDLLASQDTEQPGHKVSDPASLVTDNG